MTLTELADEIIANTDKGEILDPIGLKHFCEMVKDVIGNYKKQNVEGNAFIIVAKDKLPAEKYEEIKNAANMLILYAEEEDARKKLADKTIKNMSEDMFND